MQIQTSQTTEKKLNQPFFHDPALYDMNEEQKLEYFRQKLEWAKDFKKRVDDFCQRVDNALKG